MFTNEQILSYAAFASSFVILTAMSLTSPDSEGCFATQVSVSSVGLSSCWDDEVLPDLSDARDGVDLCEMVEPPELIFSSASVASAASLWSASGEHESWSASTTRAVS